MLRPGRGGANLPSYGGGVPPAGSTNGGGGGGAYGGYNAAGGGYAGYGQQQQSSDSGYGGYTGGGGPAYGGYSAAPVASAATSGSFKDKSRGRPRRGQPSVVNTVMDIIRLPITWVSLLAFMFALSTIAYYAERNKFLQGMNVRSLTQAVQKLEELNRHNERLNRDVQALRDTSRTFGEKRLQLEKENRELKKEKDQLAAQHKTALAQKTDESKWTAREEAWKGQLVLLQKAMKRESKRATIEKFGNPPYQVEFAVTFPDDDHDKRHFFVVEMAPLEATPHAVYIFLQQVSHGLWNNAWFYINGPHVMQAGPQADEDEEESEHGDERAVALKPFRDLQLDTLAFPDYSEDFPHVPWTLGFTGRPGGPDFYINKVDNTVAHGPGGQHQHELGEFADTCFAKIVKGFDVVEKIAHSATIHEGDYRFFFEDPIHIVQAQILKSAVRAEKTAGDLHEEAHDEHHHDEHDHDESHHDEHHDAPKPKRKFHIPKIEHAVEP